MKIPRYRGARPEKEGGKVVGESYDHVSWMPEWYRKFFNAPVIKPQIRLSKILYPKGEEEKNPSGVAG